MSERHWRLNGAGIDPFNGIPKYKAESSSYARTSRGCEVFTAAALPLGELELRDGDETVAAIAPEASPLFKKWAADRLARNTEPDDSHWSVPDLGGEEW